jgi:hypothetical protein
MPFLAGSRFPMRSTMMSYSAWMFASFTTFVHFAISIFSHRENSSGVFPIGSPPSADNCFVTSG